MRVSRYGRETSGEPGHGPNGAAVCMEKRCMCVCLCVCKSLFWGSLQRARAGRRVKGGGMCLGRRERLTPGDQYVFDWILENLGNRHLQTKPKGL